MANNSGKKNNLNPIKRPNLSKNSSYSQKEIEIFQQINQELSKGKDTLMNNFPTIKVGSFLDSNLESILLSLIGFFLPIYLRNLKRQELYAGDEFWSKISLLLVLPVLTISFLLSIDFFKEKKVFRILLSLSVFFSSLVFVVFLFSLQRPQARFANIIHEYKECFQTSQSICNKKQKGVYEDFLFSKDGTYLRSDESLLLALADGIRPHSIWEKLGTGDLTEQKNLQSEFVKRGLVYYISKIELGLSPEEIFSDSYGRAVFYSIAFAEANPDLLEIGILPEEFKSKLSLNPSPNFPIGILNYERLNSFYTSILEDTSNLSKEETFLAVYFLTQFSVDLDRFSFSNLLEHWIEFNAEYANEIRYIMYIRNQIREQLINVKKENMPVGVTFLEKNDYNFYKPFLMSTGIEFREGNDISFTFHFELEEKNEGSSFEKIIFPELPANEEGISVFMILAHGSIEKENKTNATTEEETWIYALPKSLVCKTCK